MEECSSALDSKTCSTLVDCYWCGDLFENQGSYHCYEGSLWKCPRRPECQRAIQEYWGCRMGAPNAYVLIFTFSCFVLILLILKRRCDHSFSKKHHTRIYLSAELEDFLVLDENSTTELMRASSDFENTEIRCSQEWSLYTKRSLGSTFKRLCTCFFLFLLLLLSLLSFILLVLSPTNPSFTVCDIRWDLTSIEKVKASSNNTSSDYLLNRDSNERISLLAEVSLSIWNPNRFDIDMNSAKGKILFHEGAVARFNWEPKNGIVSISSGHVYDTRFVIEVEDWNAIRKVPNFLEDWISVQGIVLSLQYSAFLYLTVIGLQTPRFALSADSIDFPLNQANRDLCRCTT